MMMMMMMMMRHSVFTGIQITILVLQTANKNNNNQTHYERGRRSFLSIVWSGDPLDGTTTTTMDRSYENILHTTINHTHTRTRDGTGLVIIYVMADR